MPGTMQDAVTGLADKLGLTGTFRVVRLAEMRGTILVIRYAELTYVDGVLVAVKELDD